MLEQFFITCHHYAWHPNTLIVNIAHELLLACAACAIPSFLSHCCFHSIRCNWSPSTPITREILWDGSHQRPSSSNTRKQLLRTRRCRTWILVNEIDRPRFAELGIVADFQLAPSSANLEFQDFLPITSRRFTPTPLPVVPVPVVSNVQLTLGMKFQNLSTTTPALRQCQLWQQLRGLFCAACKGSYLDVAY